MDESLISKAISIFTANGDINPHNIETIQKALLELKKFLSILLEPFVSKKISAKSNSLKKYFSFVFPVEYSNFMRIQEDLEFIKEDEIHIRRKSSHYKIKGNDEINDFFIELTKNMEEKEYFEFCKSRQASLSISNNFFKEELKGIKLRRSLIKFLEYALTKSLGMIILCSNKHIKGAYSLLETSIQPAQLNFDFLEKVERSRKLFLMRAHDNEKRSKSLLKREWKKYSIFLMGEGRHAVKNIPILYKDMWRKRLKIERSFRGKVFTKKFINLYSEDPFTLFYINELRKCSGKYNFKDIFHRWLLHRTSQKIETDEKEGKTLESIWD